MRLESGFEERRARIEMVPLMDVVFLLLVFFIYAMFSMAAHHGVRVDLPQAPGVPETGSRLVVTILADDRLQLNGREMPLDDMVVAVVDQHRRSRLPVLISADRAARLGTGIELLARLQSAAVAGVAFQVREE